MWESPVSEFEGLDLSDLGTDQAFVRVSWSSSPAWLYHLETDCEDCPWQLLGPVSSSPFILSTHHTNRLLLRRNNSTRSGRENSSKYSVKIFQAHHHGGC